MTEKLLHIKGLWDGYYHLYSNELPTKFKIIALDLHEHFEEKINSMIHAFLDYCNLNDLFKNKDEALTE